MNQGKKTICAIAFLSSLVIFASGCSAKKTYGCKNNAPFQKLSSGTYKGTIDPRYYLNPTGITVKNGDLLDIAVTGKICFAAYESKYCGGPEGSAFTWPLYWTFINKNGKATRPEVIGKGIDDKILDFATDEEYELNFMIPEWTSIDHCYKKHRQDNHGFFEAVVKVNK